MTMKEKLERVLNTPDRELRAFHIHTKNRQPTSVSKENRLILRRGITLVVSLGLLSVLALLPVQAQVFTGDLTLSTQADVDAFSYTEITGSLRIVDAQEITNLDGLSSLISVGGELAILDGAVLPNLDGLNSLTSVDGGVAILGNAVLPNLDGLSGLSSVGGGLVISGNASLDNLDSLPGVTSLGGSLEISGNAVLTSLGGLSGLASIAGGLSIRNNTALASLDGFSSLTSVGGGFAIRMQGALRSLEGLRNLTSVGGDLIIEGNASLTSLDEFHRVTTVRTLTIEDNDRLPTLHGLNGITSVGGDFVIRGNAALTSLVALGEIASISGHMIIEDNTMLPSLDGLSGITSVGGDVRINGNPALGACSCGIGTLLIPQYVSDNVSGMVRIENNFGSCSAVPDILVTPCGAQTAVEDLSVVPERFALRANYPNPFPSQTTLAFDLPKRSDVRLILYDTAGRTLVTLIEETLSPGAYRYTWQSRGLPSGVYYYRLEAGAYTETRGMVLIK